MHPSERLNHFQGIMIEHNLAGALLFYSRDILYYTGTAQPAYLAVLPDKYTLFVRSGFDFAVNDVFINTERIRAERNLEIIFHEFFEPHIKNATVGTELDILSVLQFGTFRNAFPGCEFTNISPLILKQRQKKSPSEIEKLRNACRTLHAGHEAVLAILHEGSSELEIAAAVENAHRLAGHEGDFFIRQPDFFMSRGPITSGGNLFRISGVVYTITGVGLSPSVPAGPSRRIIQHGDPVIVDIPTHVDGYHADQTRTYIVGHAAPRIADLYKALRDIADYLIEHITPGMRCSDIYRIALAHAAVLNVSDSFLNFGKGRRSRLLGHGIGLELNEPPIPSEYDHSTVDENYVLALDMHMLDESAGVVKLEDMIVVRECGNELLTFTPRQLFEV